MSQGPEGSDPNRTPDPSATRTPPAGSPSPPPSQVAASAAPPGQAERRKYLRFHVEGAVARIYPRGVLTSLGLARGNAAKEAINLSEGGALLLSKQRQKVGAKVFVRVDIEKYRETLEANAVVIWCEEAARPSGHFYIGVKFDAVDAGWCAKIAALRGYLKSEAAVARDRARRRESGQLPNPFRPS